MELQLSNGVTFVIDDTLNKIFVGDAHGIQEVNLDTALLDWANGDPGRASALRKKFRTTLNDPMREMSLTADEFLGSSSMWGSDTTCLSADASCGGSGPEFGTYTAPLSDFQASGWGGYSMRFMAFHPPEDEDEDDRRNWERSRNASCEAAATSARTIALMVPAAVAACASVAWCVVGALAIANELDSWASASTACRAPYPGPDGW